MEGGPMNFKTADRVAPVQRSDFDDHGRHI
jgi:hypothetical protein